MGHMPLMPCKNGNGPVYKHFFPASYFCDTDQWAGGPISMPFQRRPKDCGANCSKSDVESPGCSWEFQTLWQPPKRFKKIKFYHGNHQSLFNFFSGWLLGTRTFVSFKQSQDWQLRVSSNCSVWRNHRSKVFTHINGDIMGKSLIMSKNAIICFYPNTIIMGKCAFNILYKWGGVLIGQTSRQMVILGQSRRHHHESHPWLQMPWNPK